MAPMEKPQYDPRENLQELATNVLKHYDIIPENITVVQSGSIKTVWKVKTSRGLYCLKRLKQTYDKAMFSVNAQIYIRQYGGHVPAIIPDKNNQPIIQANRQLYVLYEWLYGTDLNFLNAADLPPSITGLAKFHLASKGYNPVEECRVSTKSGKWPDQYSSMRNKFAAWKETAKAAPSSPDHTAYLKVAEPMIELADQAFSFLAQSEYTTFAADGSDHLVLCHQDYGKGNALLTDQGVAVIDLDGVTFDLPGRDLRKIIGKLAESKGQWEPSTIGKVLELYTQVNPLNEAEKKVLYIDLLFPHWFYGLLKNLYQNNKPLKAAEIEKIARLEASKIPILQNLILKG
jgi:spore coat protein I